MSASTRPQNLSSDERGTHQPTTSCKRTAEAKESKIDADMEGQAALASSDYQESPPTTQTTLLWGIPEWVRAEGGKLKQVREGYTFPSDKVGDIPKRFARAEYKRDPMERISIPTGYADYGTTEELFARIKLAIADQTHLPDNDCALLTLWVFSTWFCDVLSLAPCLVMTGSAHDGDSVLRALNAFCYHPILVAGVTPSTLNEIKWDMKPTLLIFEQGLSKRLAGFLCSSTRRGYLAGLVAGSRKSAIDYYGSKAVYVGEDLPIRANLLHCIHINVTQTAGINSRHVVPISEEMTQNVQNQLLNYRTNYLPIVSILESSTPGLSPDFDAIASVLRDCIVDAPDLRQEVLSLFIPYSEQQDAERLDDLGILAVGVAFVLCHQNDNLIRVCDIAKNINEILKRRGERISYSPEKVGHRLKKAGLPSRRISASGNGYLLDHATRVRIHEVTAAHGFVGSNENDENLHCPLCEQYKSLMEVLLDVEVPDM